MFEVSPIESPSELTFRPEPAPSYCRILVVDDERMNRAMLANVLERNNYVVVEAADGSEALRKITEEPIDLVLLDLVMPDMDGLELLDKIRQFKTVSELPVIMVTAADDSKQIVTAFRHGANDYVTKPIDVGITLARIDTQMRLVHAQGALRKSEERYALAARGTNDGLWDWDCDGNEVYYSPRWKQMLGIDENQVVTSIEEWLSRIHVEDRGRADTELEAHMRGDTPHFEAELRMRHENGSYRWMLCRGLAVRNDANEVRRMAGSLTDITEGKVVDALTALPNRRLFLERLQRWVDRLHRNSKERFAVLYLDLDNFKLVNDSLGHEAGDQLLISVARRLEGSVRSSEAVIARLGGDEFTILLENVESDQTAVKIAHRIINSVSAPFSLGGGREVFPSVSVGISYPTGKSTSAEDLLREADTAMYAAKSRGKSCFEVFDPSMQQKVAARLDLENELRRAVERSDWILHYQSIVDLKTARVVGLEALVRWQHPQRGLIPPGDFIPIAEETGMIVPIGQWVLREACSTMARWKAQLLASDRLSISVNVSGKQFSAGDLVAEVMSVLGETGLAPEDLKLEVTETAIMEKPQEGAELLAALRECGVTIGIDDFGTGYSSLSSLHRLPLDLLKVDRTFVNKMVQSQENRAIVRTILMLADSLNLDVVAEGIETEEQRQLLLSMGCTYGQGFYFSRPLTLDQVERSLAEDRHNPSGNSPEPDRQLEWEKQGGWDLS